MSFSVPSRLSFILTLPIILKTVARFAFPTHPRDQPKIMSLLPTIPYSEEHWFNIWPDHSIPALAERAVKTPPFLRPLKNKDRRACGVGRPGCLSSSHRKGRPGDGFCNVNSVGGMPITASTTEGTSIHDFREQARLWF